MKHIAFILDGFELRSPGQQLLDRFLIGFHDNGVFRQADQRVTVFTPNGGDSALLRQRTQDFGLAVATSVEEALKAADAIVLAPGLKEPQPVHLLNIINAAPNGVACYVDGLAIRRSADVDEIEAAARARNVRWRVGTAASFFVPLPASPKFDANRVSRLLMVAHGALPTAEIHALYATDQLLGASLRSATAPLVQLLTRDALWDTAYSPVWLPLLSAAVSRSNNIKGDPERDGRTQDIVGLRLMEKLAPQARGVLIDWGGLKLFLLVAEGAVADFNYAAASEGNTYSAQLYRPQAPQEDHYSEQTRDIHAFFRDPALPTDTRCARFATRILDALVG